MSDDHVTPLNIKGMSSKLKLKGNSGEDMTYFCTRRPGCENQLWSCPHCRTRTPHFEACCDEHEEDRTIKARGPRVVIFHPNCSCAGARAAREEARRLEEEQREEEERERNSKGKMRRKAGKLVERARSKSPFSKRRRPRREDDDENPMPQGSSRYGRV